MKKITAMLATLVIVATAMSCSANIVYNTTTNSADAWTGTIRIEGEESTIWTGIVTVGETDIEAIDSSTGELETYHLSIPCPLGALDEASKQGGFSYTVTYYADWNSFFINAIGDDLDWWMYWVDFEQPWVGAGSYELTEEHDDVLWGYLVTFPPDYESHALRISSEKSSVKPNEEFTVTAYDEIMSPVENAIVYADSMTFTTDENGEATISIDAKGSYPIYAEKDRYVRSEKLPLTVKKDKLLTTPQKGHLYASFTEPDGQPVWFFGSLILFVFEDIKVTAESDSDSIEFILEHKQKGEIAQETITSTSGVFTCNFGKHETGFYKITANAKDNGVTTESETISNIFSLGI